MLDQLSLADFASHLSQDFVFRAADGTFQLRLIEAVPLRQPSPRPHPPFRLLFRSADQLRLPQGNYELQHPQQGALILFMVPVQPDAQGPCYEVIFN